MSRSASILLQLGRVGFALALLASAGCNPTVRQTVEDGVITSSTALLGSVFTALVQVAQDAG